LTTIIYTRICIYRCARLPERILASVQRDLPWRGRGCKKTMKLPKMVG